MTKTDRDGQALDAVGEAVQKTDEDAHRKLAARANLTSGGEINITVPHPFTPDDFESSIVILLNLRAQSQAMVEQEKHSGIVVPPRTGLVGPGGNRLT